MFRICSEFSAIFRIFRIGSEFSAMFRICLEFSVIFRICSECVQNFQQCSESIQNLFRILSNFQNFQTLFRISSTKTGLFRISWLCSDKTYCVEIYDHNSISLYISLFLKLTVHSTYTEKLQINEQIKLYTNTVNRQMELAGRTNYHIYISNKFT